MLTLLELAQYYCIGSVVTGVAFAPALLTGNDDHFEPSAKAFAVLGSMAVAWPALYVLIGAASFLDWYCPLLPLEKKAADENAPVTAELVEENPYAAPQSLPPDRATV